MKQRDAPWIPAFGEDDGLQGTRYSCNVTVTKQCDAPWIPAFGEDDGLRDLVIQA